ncbi:hypothetical protein B0T17DRAFT_638128 [Bombardia bombarda]|uniref:Uncharacterized protein n=1 Tax=Bombardia bombarda TaxID=252184 RepID=A0AA39WZK1_9PEZI|nr:hypothetical protein B0T17DRAFT_638128 [Bombardia bombarda]
MASSSPAKPTVARYFGQTSLKELMELERNASNATGRQLAKAAYYLQHAFTGQYYAWFGAWALRLRGSRRDTSDIDLSVLLEDIGQVRELFLAMHDSRILVTLRASSVPRPPFDASCSAETRATGGGGGGGGLSLEDVVAMKLNGRN